VFFDATWEMPPRTRRRQGGLLRPIRSLASAAGRSLLRRVSRKLDFRHLSAEGVLDLQARRYMLDRGGYARLGADGKEWGGPTGRPVPTRAADVANWPTPLWLIDVLAGLTAATPKGTEDVRGTPCRRFDVIVDLSRASKFTPGAVAAPKVGRFEDLLALPIEVWVDDQHVRRVRFSQDGRIDTLELWDVGVPLEDLDWTEFHAFRSSLAS
jgi:hypothetical protein